MSRLEVKTPGQAQAVVEQLYRNMERRIAASPPGLCPVDMALNFLDLCRAQTCGKCVPCRIGLTQLSNMIREVLDGEPDLSILRAGWPRCAAPYSDRAVPPPPGPRRGSLLPVCSCCHFFPENFFGFLNIIMAPILQDVKENRPGHRGHGGLRHRY